MARRSDNPRIDNAATEEAAWKKQLETKLTAESLAAAGSAFEAIELQRRLDLLGDNYMYINMHIYIYMAMCKYIMAYKCIFN